MALEAASSIFFFSNCRLHSFKKSSSSLKSLPLNFSLLYNSNRPLLSSNSPPTKKPAFKLYSTAESLTVEEEQEQENEDEDEEVGNSGKPDSRRKLFVLNLPWSFSVVDIKKVFGECGTVADVEIIKQKNGKSRGFAFVTMSSGEEAQLAIEKFDSYELVGRIIRVQFAKRFKKKPVRAVPEGPTPPLASGETRHKLYVSNLAWKVRSNNLREFFSSDFNPVSARVVFGGTVGRSAGYGFVSFATKEEAESAISVFDGKELLGRPIRLKFSENKPQNKQESSSGVVESKDRSSSDASQSIQESSSGAVKSEDESSSDASGSQQEAGEQGS